MDILLKASVRCSAGFFKIPTYRVWVNDNLYTEREFWVDFTHDMIVEHMTVDLDIGEQSVVKLEKIRPKSNSIVWISNLEVTYDKKNYIMKYERDTVLNDIQRISFEIV